MKEISFCQIRFLNLKMLKFSGPVFLDELDNGRCRITSYPNIVPVFVSLQIACAIIGGLVANPGWIFVDWQIAWQRRFGDDVIDLYGHVCFVQDFD